MSFHSRVLLSLLVLCWLMVGVFLVFQYGREKTFRSELLNMELQMHNARIIDDLSTGEDITSIEERIGSPLPDLRLTLIGKDGNVIYDNNNKTPFPSSNHNDRPEVAGARKNGVGYSVGRHSVSDDTEYFYSAMSGPDGLVVRSAAPYNPTLRQLLEADRTFLWIMLGVTLSVSVAGYIIAKRISMSIMRLNNFAEKAERGERIFEDWTFPNDELGSIASHIVRLYVQRDEQHREAMRQERERIRIKKQLTNNINHELKTPVASIFICSELLRDHPELPKAKRDEFLGRIHGSAVRLDSMLKDISYITRMDDGGDVIEKTPVNLSEIVDCVVAEERLKTEMLFKISVPPIVINGNRVLIESMFRNLITNAVAYSGGTEISIIADDKGNFTFRDNGSGVGEEHLEHIFERFYRVDKGRSRANGGTGLGLAIVKNAVSIHGGRIRAVNDGGLRLDFNLC